MVNGLENAGKSRLVLELIEEARNRGLQVSVDIFPYWFEEALHFSPLLSSILPEWASDGGRRRCGRASRIPRSVPGCWPSCGPANPRELTWCPDGQSRRPMG